MVAQAAQGVHAQGGRDRAGRLGGGKNQLAERDDLDEGTQGFDRLDLLGRKTTFGADDECDMAVDIAALERVGDGKRRAVRPLVRFLPGDDDRSYSASSRQMSSSPVGSSTMGRMLRPDCLAAESAMRRHREPLRPRSSTARRTTVRAERKGMMRPIPSSVVWRMVCPMRSPFEMPCTSVRSGSFSSGISWMQRPRCLELVDRLDLDFPAFAAGSDGRDVLALPDAAHREVVQFFIGEGKGDDIAFGQFAFHEKTRYGHVCLPLARARDA